MKNRINISTIILGMLLISHICYTQEETGNGTNDNLWVKEKAFQESFFEALKQKGIQNYSKAVEELLTCLDLQPSNVVIYFELGKNYAFLKNFGKAEEMLNKAIEAEPDNRWFLNALYQVYVQTNNNDKAITTLKKLSNLHTSYQYMLADAYYHNGNYRKALNTLDELNNQIGFSNKQDILRRAIYNASGDDRGRIEYLIELIERQPKNEINYLNLIYQYRAIGKEEKAFQIAQKLLEINPSSHLVHLALYKHYIADKNLEQAVASMKIVTNSSVIIPDSKTKVLNDFVKFVENNPQYEADLLEVTSKIIDDGTGKSHLELAQYYLQKEDKKKALENFKKALTADSENFMLLKNVVLLHIELGNYSEAQKQSKSALELFPSQPVLYLVNGLANNYLNKPNAAIEALETGVDFVIDNIIMEVDFYKQLSTAYKLKNNISKSQAFSKKADQLLNKNNP